MFLKIHFKITLYYNNSIHGKFLKEIHFHKIDSVSHSIDMSYFGLIKSLILLKNGKINKRDKNLIWCHHINSSRWIQLILSLSGYNTILAERLLPENYANNFKRL